MSRGNNHELLGIAKSRRWKRKRDRKGRKGRKTNSRETGYTN
jgi:hypothetical protein